LQSTLKRELKVRETVYRETGGTTKSDLGVGFSRGFCKGRHFTVARREVFAYICRFRGVLPYAPRDDALTG
jgi:hypothetical protein